jgi:CO dehydrogenase/acetyl-CoA synthase beta subunit
MSKSSQYRYMQRMQEQGFSKVTCWVPIEKKEVILALAERIRNKHRVEEVAERDKELDKMLQEI